MRRVILVGIRAGDPLRDRNWAYARHKWETNLAFPIFEGHHDDGPYSMAIASNRAAALAGDWDVALYVGADFLLDDYRQGWMALDTAEHTSKLCFAHTQLTLLTEQESAEITAGRMAPRESVEKRHPNTFSGALAVPRVLWDAVGGFDERFIGWGYEDLSFWAACCAVGGGFHRVPGEMFHLYHDRTRAENEEQPFHSQNQVLGERYLAAKHSLPKTLEIIRERPTPSRDIPVPEPEVA